MFYYEIAVGGRQKSDKSVFTYSSSKIIPIGSVVKVPFGKKSALGFIVNKSPKPQFKTKNLEKVLMLTIDRPHLKTYLSLIELYPFAGQQLAQLFLPQEVVSESEDLVENCTTISLPPLNEEQKEAYEKIIDGSTTTLLFGETGSGKTRLYTHLAKYYIDRGKNVILLTPEIGLASYTFKEIGNFLPKTILYHSELTRKQRSSIWSKVYKESGLLVIGPRSALTLPVSNIGLIIMDESHDQAYRQESFPYVHSRTIAALLAKYSGSFCVYGTATPPVGDMYNAKALGVPVIRLDNIATSDKMIADVEILERDKNSIGSNALFPKSIEAINETFKRGGQALILINKRGTARYISCESCGHEVRCNNCDHLMAYHHDRHRLFCHRCGSSQSVPTICPICSNATIKMSSHGAKSIEKELKEMFPRVVMRRFDTDNTKKEHLSQYTDQLKNGVIQCAIGTQMLAKGLDLPHLEIVVVVGSGGISGGFSGEEKEFQLLYQVIGRAIRGHRDTRVIIQTTNPRGTFLRSAVDRDYFNFFEKEIDERRKYRYPPFVHLGIIHISRATSLSCQKHGIKLADELRSKFRNVEFIGPTANIFEKSGGKFHWHILMKSKSRPNLTDVVQYLGTSYSCELDPVDTP